MARVAEQAERFEDMSDFLKPLLKQNKTHFTADERNLLSTGFKNLIASKRTALKTINTIEQNSKADPLLLQTLPYIKKKIEF